MCVWQRWYDKLQTSRTLAGGAAARSGLVSSGQFPSSFGTASAMSMNKNRTLGGLMGANDQLWRKAAIKGVQSETGSNKDHAALSAKSPSVHTG